MSQFGTVFKLWAWKYKIGHNWNDSNQICPKNGKPTESVTIELILIKGVPKMECQRYLSQIIVAAKLWHNLKPHQKDGNSFEYALSFSSLSLGLNKSNE